jgi:two-component system, OmpR family, sensor histidine kinase KdpD
VARGRYRILLGMAAGVGKTYRMLQEGRQAQTESRDVVIGYLEPHDRPETSALAEGLEVVPRMRAEHGTLQLEEMDVDAVLRRAPELALIDELAHTNASGTRNQKRYQDIDEILEAGIDVISTVNVQHLESLNDAVFELTETRVRETFPDRILNQADEVVLVDLTPVARSTPANVRRSPWTTSSGQSGSRRSASSRCARSPRTSSTGGPRRLSSR